MEIFQNKGEDVNAFQFQFKDHDLNPLIEPMKPHWMIADPTVVSPHESPDNTWHLIANSVGFLNHFVSENGIQWKLEKKKLCQGIRPFIFHEGEFYYLLYERFFKPWQSSIVMRKSKDLRNWSDYKVLLSAQKATDGGFIRFVSCPCLHKHNDMYRLYYSYNWVFLKDCLYFEPRNIGWASSDIIDGPYLREQDNFIQPDKNNPYFNLGAGSMKIIPASEEGYFIFNNSIYKDSLGKSRSAIHIHWSKDGNTIDTFSEKPIIAPSDKTWKHAFVYAFDVKEYNNVLYLYYNARDGWFRGKERIGLATAAID